MASRKSEENTPTHSKRGELTVKKLTQLHVDVSAYLFAFTLTVLLCLAAAALCYIELCANETLLSSGGRLYGFFQRMIDIVDGYL